MICSVVVTTLGGPYLDVQLAALAAQSQPPGQVVIVNNGPAGAVADQWERWSARLPHSVLVEDDAAASCSYARNRGADVAAHPGILFLDDDDEVHPDYVAAMSAALDTAELVGARTDLARLNTAGLARSWGRMQFDGLMTQHDFLPWCVGGAMGVRRDVLASVGGFDETLTACEDTDLSWRAQLEAGARAAFCPSAVVSYRLRSTAGGAFRQARAWGAAEVLLQRRYELVGRPGVGSAVRRARRWARVMQVLLASSDPSRFVAAARLAGHDLGTLQAAVGGSRPSGERRSRRSGTGVELHVVYRSYGGENRKDRPDWYSKALALKSLVRAVDAVPGGVEVVFVNDGPLPADRLALMQATGAEVLRIDKGSNRGSLRWTLDMARRRPWPAGDLVLFLEDDYLFAPDALVGLLDGAARRPDVDYFAVYAVPSQAASPEATTDRAGAGPGTSSWIPVASTTSSFAVRVRALREDHGRLSLLPFTGGAWDHATCLAVQGRLPFRLRDIVRPDPAPAGTPVLRRAARVTALGLVRLAAQTSALRRADRRRKLYGPSPALATHMELGVLSEGRDWPQLGAETERWWQANQAQPAAGGALRRW